MALYLGDVPERHVRRPPRPEEVLHSADMAATADLLITTANVAEGAFEDPESFEEEEVLSLGSDGEEYLSTDLTGGAVEDDLDKLWQKSIVVRRRKMASQTVPHPDTDETNTFALHEGLTSDLAKPYFMALTLLKDHINSRNCSAEFSEDVKVLMDAYRSVYPKPFVHGHCRSHLYQQHVSSKRKITISGEMFNRNNKDMFVTGTGTKTNNLFTAISCQTVGDISNAVPMRTHIAFHLLHNKPRFLIDEGPTDTYDAILECLYPKGTVNHALLQATAEAFNIRIEVFAHSSYVADMHPLLSDLRGSYFPVQDEELSEPDYTSTMAVLVTPTFGAYKSFDTYPVLSRTELVDFQARVLDTEEHRPFSKLLPYRDVTDDAQSTLCMQKDLVFYERMKEHGHLCPEHSAIQPAVLNDLEEETAEIPLQPPYIDSLEWDKVPDEDKTDYGYVFPNTTAKTDFIRPKDLISTLETFIDEKEEPQEYPLLPQESAVFICMAREEPEAAHGAWKESRTYNFWYSYPE